MFSICDISDVCTVAASSCADVDGTCDSSCVPSIELTSDDAICGISGPSKGGSVVCDMTSDGSPGGTMLLMSETDGSAGKDISGGIDDSEERLCCAIIFGISASFGWISVGVGWGG